MRSEKTRGNPLRWLSAHLHSREKPAEVGSEVSGAGTGTTTHSDEDHHDPPLRDAQSENPTKEEAAAELYKVPDQATTIENPSATSDLEPKRISFWDRATAMLAKENGELYATLEEYRGQSDKLAQSLTHGEAESEGKEEEEGLNRGPRTIADTIAGVAQKQMEDMEHRQWALPAKVSGNETRIRPLLAKILTYANGVKKSANNLIDLDPTGYAKLAWLPFSLVLDLATLDIEQYYAALDAFSDLSLLVYRYKSVEDFYRSQESDTVFEKQLVKLYRMVLECQVALIAHFRRNGLLKFLRAAVGVGDWVSKLEDIGKQDDHCQKLLNKYKDQGLVFLQENTQRLVVDVNRTEIRTMLQWIGHDPSGERKRILEDSKLDSDFENAGGWLMQGDNFQKWSSTESKNELQLFWIHGPVGCGKTSLTTRVIENFLNRAFHDEQEQVAYFYCNKRNGAGSSVLDILRSLVRQLAYTSKHMKVDDHIKSLWKSRSSPDTDLLTLRECKQIFSRLLGESSYTTTLLIDALDECEKPQQLLSELKEISDALQKITVGSGTVRAFLSSRNDVDVARIFPSCESVNITPTLVSEDFGYFVSRFVEIQCARGHELGDEENAAIRQRLIQSVTARGQGSFKWA
ncbi:hypothetical protein BJX66DRAFT_232430 [Aspergillus keveii]|uniref:NACHT domain-containing protein n=1 Tax=Aspergillus keveii TaxID=714993 RepID=A0ABR4G2H4_9EURO